METNFIVLSIYEDLPVLKVGFGLDYETRFELMENKLYIIYDFHSLLEFGLGKKFELIDHKVYRTKVFIRMCKNLGSDLYKTGLKVGLIFFQLGWMMKLIELR